MAVSVARGNRGAGSAGCWGVFFHFALRSFQTLLRIFCLGVAWACVRGRELAIVSFCCYLYIRPAIEPAIYTPCISHLCFYRRGRVLGRGTVHFTFIERRAHGRALLWLWLIKLKKSSIANRQSSIAHTHTHTHTHTPKGGMNSPR